MFREGKKLPQEYTEASSRHETEKPSLRERLAARLDRWNQKSASFREGYRTLPGSFENRIVRDLVRGPARVWENVGALAEKTTAILRDRLRPKIKSNESPETPQ